MESKSVSSTPPQFLLPSVADCKFPGEINPFLPKWLLIVVFITAIESKLEQSSPTDSCLEHFAPQVVILLWEAVGHVTVGSGWQKSFG